MFSLIAPQNIIGQGDSYCTSTSLSINSTCITQAGSTSGFSNDPEFDQTCSTFGNNDDEGWYWLTGGTIGEDYTVDVTTTLGGSDMVVAVVGVTGASCTSPTEIDCVDGVISGTESITFTWTADHDFYYVMLFEYGSGSGSFDICAHGSVGGGPTCSDGIQNGNETGVDCGGPDCPACGGGGGGDNCSGPDAATDDCIDAPLVSFNQPYNGSTDCGFTIDEPYSPYGNDCGTLQNNSWISFVAAEESLDFEITVADIDGSTNDPFFTCDSGVQFSLWEGSCGSLSLVSDVCENPVTDPNVGETNTFTLTGMIPGNTYYLMVDGYAGEECDYVLDPGEGIVLCDNNECNGAESINCNTPNIINGLQCATDTDADNNCSGSGNANEGLWYSFSGNGDEVTLSVSNSATDFSANIHVYEGSCGAKLCVGGATGNGTADVTFTSINGTDYFIYIDGDGGATGIYELSINCMSGPGCPADVGTYTIAIDGVTQSSCSDYNLPSGSTITYVSNMDFTLPPEASGVHPAGIGFAIFGCDPVAAGYDLTDPSIYNSSNSCFLDMDNDQDQNFDTQETNCAGSSGTDPSWPTTVWVVPVTLDLDCNTGGFGCGWNVDDDGDMCVDAGCPMGLTYDPLPTYTCGDTFYDSGGVNSSYCGNENSEWLICPFDPSDPVTVTFTSINIEGGGTCWDELSVYDGQSSSAPEIGSGYCGTSPPGPFTSTDASGCLFFTFTSDEFVFGDWEATVSCSTPACEVTPSSCGSTTSGTLTSGTTTSIPSVSSSCIGSFFDTGHWISFVGDGNPTTISTDNPGTSFDTRIHVYTLTGADPCTGTLIQEACDDDGGTILESELTLTTINGETYYIFIDGASGALGNYELSIECSSSETCDCTNPTCLGMHYCSAAEAQSEYDDPFSTAGEYDINPDLPTGTGVSYEICWEYTTSDTEITVGFVNLLGFEFGNDPLCLVDRMYHVYTDDCGSELTPSGPTSFGNGFEYTVMPNTTYHFCVDVSFPNGNCGDIQNTYGYIYGSCGCDADAGTYDITGVSSPGVGEDMPGNYTVTCCEDLEIDYNFDGTNAPQDLSCSGAELAYAVFTCDPAALDLTDENSYTGGCFEELISSNPFTDTNNDGLSTTYGVSDIWVVPVTLDCGDCAPSCDWTNIDANGDDCVDFSGPFHIDYDSGCDSGGCGTCATPCTESGMGSVSTYPDRSYLSCWTPDCDIYGPGSFTNCFEATADATGFLGFANQIQNSIPGCINISWELTADGDCGNVIANPTPNANSVGSGFNPEYTGLTPSGTYVLCVTYTLPDFLCGLDGASSFNPDFICIDSYGTDCSVDLEATSMDGFACKDDGRDVTTITSWVETTAVGFQFTGFAVFCSTPTLPITQTYFDANSLSAILEETDAIGNFINNNGDYVDPIDGTTCSGGSIFLLPITIASIDGGGSFVIDWTCFDTEDVIEVELGVPPTPTAMASETDICSGETVTLTAGGGGTYQWSDGLGTNPVVMVSPTSTTTYTVTVTDDSGNCSDEADVTVNVSMIEHTVANVECDDNGTPTDPSDDTFSFEVTVTGTNTDPSGWTANDAATTTGGYGTAVTFGSYPISGGPISFVITDNGPGMCTTTVTVTPPPTCSAECDISAVASNIVCNNNSTASDDTDDTFTFDVTVSGDNTGSGWTVISGDPNNTAGSYDIATQIGPFNIADGVVTITIEDADNPGCTTTIMVTPPTTCSNTCSISNIVSNIACFDNNTPTDPSDDTYTFDIVVTGSNVGSGWSADDILSSTGLYTVTVSMGPYNIADGPLSFTITDDTDSGCTTTVNVTPPATCSDECEINTMVTSIVCNDNNTPSDPTDDTFTFEVTVSGSNTGSSWTANDPNNISGSYDVPTTFGPYIIGAGGVLNFSIIDGSDNGCTASVMVTPPATCSDMCEIDAVVSNILCNDNNTPSDPTDDTFTFEVDVTGSNTGTGWTADDVNTTSGNYTGTTTFGPYAISGGDLTITITDDTDMTCTAVIMVTPPATCSDECDIDAVVSNVLCNDNNTPSDPTDDTYTFEVNVTGSNTSATWTATDPNTTTGSYGNTITFGPYNITGGDLTFTIADGVDGTCTTTVMVSAPATCSDQCDITAAFANVVCNDNGTPSNPDDDTFTFTITVSGTNTGSGWTSDDTGNPSGSYDVTTSFGPYNIANGTVTINITDDTDPACQDMVTVTPPMTCSGTCSISNVVSNIICDDNNTPSDPSDDTYTFDIIVNGANEGASWTANDPNNTTGLYGVTVSFGPYNIADGPLTFTITDIDDMACTTVVNITPPATCSDECDIDAVLSSIVCDDNGTPSDPSDDTYTFVVTVTGSNTGSSWTATDPNGTTGSYGSPTTFGPYNIGAGTDLNFSIIDGVDNGCTASVMVTPPATCSDMCDIDAIVSNIACDDNGTPSDPTDDTFTFDVDVTGSNTATSWTADDANTTSGNYTGTTTFGSYPISGGTLTIIITDDNDMTCTAVIMVTPPVSCSDECEINTMVSNIVCDDNGTPSDPTDDTYTFDVDISGSNVSGGWGANDPNSTSGTYGGTTTFGPYPISGGNLSFTITDNSDITCTTTVMITAPSTCSDMCDISTLVSNIICNDNGTPSDPDDDTFTFTVVVTGSNTGTGWSANDPSSTTGTYGNATIFGPFNISNGNVIVTISDDIDANCTDIINVTAPNTCSGTCSISNVVSNIICDDNGTPSDPSDDTFSFDIIVSGSNTGASWTADDPNTSTGLYGVLVNLGPFSIADGNLNFTITDIDDAMCTTIVGVIPPTTCSDECDIDAVVSNIMCADNGTPSDPTDDTYTFDITVTGSNTGSSWTANDPNGTSGSYNTVTTFGPFNIGAGGILNFSIIDGNDSGCTASVSVTPPAPCSDLCDINAIVSNIVCDDNGTPSDPSDDTFTFDVDVTGSNTGVTWTADDATSTTGDYISSTTFGPFDISDGSLTITITDDSDMTCTTTMMITPPSPCSDLCVIDAVVTNIMCSDNGTPSDPTDDTYTFDVEVTGSNVSGGWMSSDPNMTSGIYGGITTFGPFDIAGGDLNFTITDNDDATCSVNVSATAPMTCSSECSISAMFSNVVCNDNGTPSNPDDDTFTFNVTVNGTNNGSGWTSDDTAIPSGTYGLGVSFGPYLITDGNITLIFTDDTDPTCQDIITVAAPSSCSGTCSISNIVTNIQCDDNGTPSDPSDDTFSFDITVNGSNEGASWTGDDPNSSSGLYGVLVNLGPYNIADGNLNFTISDIDDAMCTTVVGVMPPMTCSDECEISTTIENILCDDNGTPSDLSDDTYTFDLTVSGSNTASTWSATDPNTTNGSYDVATTFGPFDIVDGVLNFTVIDGLDNGCTALVSVTPPPTCSDVCDIDATISNIICDDNGTSSDPTDDTYTFEAIITGSNTAAGWSADDAFGLTGTYGTTAIFGPYPITSTILTVVITDDNDLGCTTSFEVTPPVTCSDACEITTTVSNIFCDDNGTPSDPTDDTFTFDVEVLGTNSSGGWNAGDPNATSGAYSTVTSFGPYLIAGGNLNFTITDNNDVACNSTVAVTAPTSCSDECNISATFGNVLCNDNGTPSNPDDDTFTFDITVTGTNTGASWIANDPMSTTDLYGAVTTIGPFNIIDGAVSVTISDFDDPTCLTSVSVSPPTACSGVCSIASTVSNVQCNDNGTPSNPDDDTFTFDITISGSNIGTGWSADDPNNSNGSYNMIETMGPYLISGGNLNFTITDADDANCTLVVGVVPPAPCSDICDITSTISNIICDDNGTSGDPSDDWYTFDVTVMGNNTGSSWTANDPFATNGSYGNPSTFGPYLISGGELLVTITDLNDPMCTEDISVTPPSTCSESCEISSMVSNVICDDNGTPTDPSDDLFTFEVLVTGTNTGSSWTANDPLNMTGAYNSTIVFGPYLISGGDISFNITDIDDPNCETGLQSISAPEPCSDMCEMAAVVSNIVCDDNGTPSDPTDDVYFFNVEVSGLNISTGWMANDPNMTAGLYNTPSTFGPYMISGGNLSFNISDSNDPNCSASVSVTAPSSCSDACSISALTSNIICSDNGTASDPTDDTFTFDVIVSGTNASTGWIANDLNGTSGGYETIVSFGPYNIINGNLNIQISDDGNNLCFTTITVNAPSSCSGTCSIGNSVSNIICSDAGTPSDPADDTYTFEVTVNGSNFGTGWMADDANNTSGAYSSATVFGPYLIDGGNQTFTISDNTDATCFTNVSVIAPSSCSDMCSVTTTITNINCQDGGTPSDASDDVFYFEITVMGDNIGSTWSATDPNNVAGSYFNVTLFGPYLISDGDLDFDIVDGLDGGCLDNVTVQAPPACSDDCIVQTSVSNIICNDSGTPADPSDDTFTFDLEITGTNTGISWTADDPNGTNGDFGTTTTFGPYIISEGQLNFNVVNNDDTSCTTTVQVDPPATCSPPCQVDFTINNLMCNDNGTPTDASDDTYSFDLMVTGTNAGTGWSADDPFNTTGIYGTMITMGPFEIANGDLLFTLSDNSIAGCEALVMVSAPAPCSGTCSISQVVSSVICNDNGTPMDESDDTFTFELLASGQNASNGWTANDINMSTGNYGVIAVLGPYLIADGDLTFNISDIDDNTCTSIVEVTAPMSCSNGCSISIDLTDMICDDAGTPANPLDDTYTFNVLLTGVNTGTSWAADDTGTTSGGYGVTVAFGPYLIADGSFDLTFADSDDASCLETILIIPPTACSGCQLSAQSIISHEICPGANDGSISITPENVTGTVTYTWSDPSVLGSQPSNLAPGSYSVILEDENGCTFPMDFVILAGEGSFTVGVTADVLSVFLNEPVNLSGSTTLPDSMIASISWSPSTVDCEDCFETVANPSEATTYTLTVTSLDGCVVSASIFIDIERVPPEVFIPNIINLSSSNNNDIFYPKGTLIEVVNYLRVYDRWGNLVFNNENFMANTPSEGWDGSFGGTQVVPGVFVYKLQFTTIYGEVGQMIGDITVIR